MLERFDGFVAIKFSNVFLSVWKFILSQESVFIVLVKLEGDGLPWELYYCDSGFDVHS